MRRSFVRLVLLALILLADAPWAAPVPTWERKITGSGRFKVPSQFDGEAVFDKETGLLWQKTAAAAGTWRNALRFCALRNTGNRMGWRMPALEELLTIVDQTRATPAIPDGAPFEGLVGSSFWTANEEEGDPTLAVTVNLDVFSLGAASKTGAARKVLCVRGGRGSTTSTRGGL